MLPYLTELTKQFTKYALADVAKMDSTHAIRMYELIMQWESVGRREISIDELREWFQLQEKYHSIKDFKLRVLDPAIAQINEHSPIMVGWTQKKTGRKITHLIFDFAPKNSAKKVAKMNSKNKLLDAEVAKLARPGETWEQARVRLNQRI